MGLDRDLLVVRRIGLRAPVALAPRAGGGLWVASAGDGRRDGPHRLLSLDALGRPAADLPSPPVRGLLGLADGGAVVLAGPGGQITRLDASGLPAARSVVPGAAAIAYGDGRVLVACRGGALWELDGSSLRRLRVGHWPGAEPQAAASRPRGGWWVLDGARRRLALLDRGLAVTSVARVDAEEPRLAAAGGPLGGIWVVDGAGPRALRFGPDGRRRLACRVPVTALETAWPDGDGLVAPAVGALVRLDGNGRPRPSQGGFAYAVAAVRTAGSLAQREQGGDQGLAVSDVELEDLPRRDPEGLDLLVGVARQSSVRSALEVARLEQVQHLRTESSGGKEGAQAAPPRGAVTRLLLQLAPRRGERILVGLQPAGRDLDRPPARRRPELSDREQPPVVVEGRHGCGAGMLDEVPGLLQPRGQAKRLPDDVEDAAPIDRIGSEQVDVWMGPEGQEG